MGLTKRERAIVNYAKLDLRMAPEGSAVEMEFKESLSILKIKVKWCNKKVETLTVHRDVEIECAKKVKKILRKEENKKGIFVVSNF